MAAETASTTDRQLGMPCEMTISAAGTILLASWHTHRSQALNDGDAQEKLSAKLSKSLIFCRLRPARITNK